MSIVAIEDKAAEPTFSSEVGHERAELAVRENCGITVTLFWARGTDIALVSVVDHNNCDGFELVLQPDEAALDVFHHPYAYAAARGLDIRPRRPAQEEAFVDV